MSISPDPQAHEVRWRSKRPVSVTPISRSQQGKLPLPTPAVLGHEAAGEVIEVGDGVTSVKPGDHVVVMWTPMCGDATCAGEARRISVSASRAWG